jgi:nitrile hydratase beta subunit
MDGMHDLGGKQGFGRVAYPSPPHDENLEPLVRALSAFALEKNVYNMDEFRHAIERMASRHYINAPYFERHLTAVATLLVEKDFIAHEELELHVDGAFPLAGPIGPGRQATPPQTFAIGDRVRVKNEYVPGHHRMLGYIRSKVGVVVGISPPYPFPDSAGHGMQAPMEPTCDVRFRSCDLWPDISAEALNHVGVLPRWVYPFRGLVSGRPMASSWTAAAGRLRPESFQPFPSK